MHRLTAALARLPFVRLLWLALVVRMLFCGLYALSSPWEQVPVQAEWYTYAGTDGYIQLARNLWVEGRWAYYPQAPATHNRPPLHPLLLAATAAWDAQHWFLWWMGAAILLQLLAMWALHQALPLLGVSPLWHRAVLLAFALHPYLVGICRASTFVPLGIVLSCLLLWRVAAYARKPHTRTAVGLGLLTGMLALTHGTFILLLGLLPLWCRPRWAHGLLALTVALLTLLPWTLWNAHTHGQFIPVATGAGIQYWKGRAWLAHTPDLEYRVYRTHTGKPLRQTYYGPDAPADDALLLKLAVADVQQAPLAYAARTAHSYALFWLPNDRSPWKQALTWLLNLPLLALACWLLVRGWPRWWHHPLGAPLALWWAGLPLAFAALAAITGYFIVLLPLLLAWVGMGLSARSLPLSVVS